MKADELDTMPFVLESENSGWTKIIKKKKKIGLQHNKDDSRVQYLCSIYLFILQSW